MMETNFFVGQTCYKKNNNNKKKASFYVFYKTSLLWYLFKK